MISEFVAMLGKRSYATPALFFVEITNAPAVISASGANEVMKDLRYYAMSVDAPGTQFLTQENRVYDVFQKYAYMKAHDDLTITFRVDAAYASKRFFDAWTDAIYNKDTGNIHYKNDYIGQLQISPMIADGSTPYAIQYEDVFPTSIGNLSYNWDGTNQILQFVVNFTFTRSKVVARENMFPSAGSFNQSNGIDTKLPTSLSDAKTRVDTYKDTVYNTAKIATNVNTNNGNLINMNSPIAFDSIKNKLNGLL